MNSRRRVPSQFILRGDQRSSSNGNLATSQISTTPDRCATARYDESGENGNRSLRIAFVPKETVT